MNRSRGARFRDRAALVVGGGVLVWSLVRPTVEEMGRSARVEAVASDVASVVAAVEAYVAERGEAPPGTASGQAPDALAPWLRGAVRFAGDDHRLDVDRWAEVVVPPLPQASDPADSVPAPAPFAVGRPAVSVHSAQGDLLAHLLDVYGGSRSFVHDTTWTLVMDRVVPPGSPPG